MLSTRSVLLLCFVIFPSLPFRLVFASSLLSPLSSPFQLHHNNIHVDTIESKLWSRNTSPDCADIQVYKELMPDPKPARTCVGVAQLPAGGTDVEIEFVAYDG